MISKTNSKPPEKHLWVDISTIIYFGTFGRFRNWLKNWKLWYKNENVGNISKKVNPAFWQVVLKTLAKLKQTFKKLSLVNRRKFHETFIKLFLMPLQPENFGGKSNNPLKKSKKDKKRKQWN